MSTFYKYPDIENSYREKFIKTFKQEVPENQDFYITEKIHGANSQLCATYIRENTWHFNYGKRTSYLIPNTKFYHLSTWFDANAIKFWKFIDRFVIDCPAVNTIIFYGEVFGGTYPHKDVKHLPNSEVTVVQHGVWYCPKNEWKCFDIGYICDNEDTIKFLSCHEFFNRCALARIPTVPLLKVVKTIDEALSYPNDGLSVVYKDFDLPSIENNIMEGVVIKPNNDQHLSTSERAIIKNKSPHFKEVHHHKVAKIIEMSDEAFYLLQVSTEYINENRLNAVISKYGEITRKEIGIIIGELGKDAFNEFCKDHESELNLLNEEQIKQIKKTFGNKSAEFIRQILVPKL